MHKKPTAAEVNDEVIKKWKEKHKRVMQYKTSDGKIAYFGNPDLTTIDAASALAATNPVKSNRTLAQACFLGGDEEVVNNDEYIIGLGAKLKELVVKVEGELSEL